VRLAIAAGNWTRDRGGRWREDPADGSVHDACVRDVCGAGGGVCGRGATSVAASTMADDDDLKAAITSAVDDVLSHAIAFSPTFVTVQTARLIGGRVYILLLIGDDDGEKMLEKLGRTP
jgi:hypothetical protein